MSMEILRTRANQIVTAGGQPIHLRGTCVGGWMNMENFINGYPGAEHTLRAVMREVLGASKAEFFFDRLLDHFFNESDIAFMKTYGATVVRLPMNYRHFESDAQPFHYLEAGFARLNKVVEWCAKHELYVILDLHSVQGWQNPSWHSDNANHITLFWENPHYQDRFVALWEELARRYKGNPTIAGYNVMNEPVTNAPRGRFTEAYTSNWEVINRVYQRVVNAIRMIDPDHIIFLEGDLFSARFNGFEPPAADNLVYSSHNYTPAGFGPGVYPGTFQGQHWDFEHQVEVFLAHPGTQYTRQHTVPLWVGEFGSLYNGPAEEVGDRLRAMDDEIRVFTMHDVHWTTWTYKDVGVMGWVTLDPNSPYIQTIGSILEAKRLLGTDSWLGNLPTTPAKDKVGELADLIVQQVGVPNLPRDEVKRYLSQAALEGYTGGLMQFAYAEKFKHMSEQQIDQVLQSFAVENCIKHVDLLTILKRHLSDGTRG